MLHPMSSQPTFIIFPGQGASFTDSTHKLALQDSSTPSGSFLLSQCYHALLAELFALSADQSHAIDLTAADFPTPQSLLDISTSSKCKSITAGTQLVLVQSLRYLNLFEIDLTPQASTLSNARPGTTYPASSFNFCGFSSGILPACIAATSPSTLQYIAHTVEAFRVAFWIGVHAELHSVRSTQDLRPLDEQGGDRCWSYVMLALDRHTALSELERFEEESKTPSTLYLTAVMDDHSVTISGRPDVLESFIATIPSTSHAHKTTVSSLYHCSDELSDIRNDTLADIKRRSIRFPTFSDIIYPIYSTLTGEPIRPTADQTLLEAVVDMIMLHPVNWDYVTRSVVSSIPSPTPNPIRLVNIGPGSGLVRTLDRVLVHNSLPFDIIDLTSLEYIGESAPAQPGSIEQQPIAVVGMAVHVPGAPDVSSLWHLLEQGLNTVSEIPESRFKVSEYQETTLYSSSTRTMRAHTGNFIDDADTFDNKFFKISPREARCMDPQQRVLLHTAYEALEDAGYVPDATETWRRDTFACYVGAATEDYVQNLRNELDVHYSTGTLRSFLSGRISYAMQFGGPSIVVDTACSSSMIAVYQACRALSSGDCNAALAGGVNIITSPDMYIGLDHAHFLSPTGQCKPFDASADGYSRAEGCGMFVLKRLSDAINERDNILGVIRGIEVNQSGCASSITHPHSPTQTALFERLLLRSGIDRHRVNVVEAHGTGTQAGDPVELESIREVFCGGVNGARRHARAPKNPLHITSVKANIGHLEAASGAAGLAKVLLMLKHRTIPAQAFFDQLNPRIPPLELDNTIVPTTNLSWQEATEGKPRVAVVNNFGAAGSNTALIIEEHVTSTTSGTTPRCREESRDSLVYVFGISAKTEEALMALRNRYVDWLQTEDGQRARLEDVAYTATSRRQLYDWRIAFSVGSKDELLQKLLGSHPSNIATATITRVPHSAPPKTVFVFSGQGSQYLGMGASLYRTQPIFRRCIDECQSILVQLGFPGVLSIILAGQESGLEWADEVQAYQAAVFAVEWAMAKTWMEWGIVPSAVIGHSLGEYAAQVIAGVLTMKGALILIANRAKLMVHKCSPKVTGMLAVNLSPEIVSRMFNKDYSPLSIACFNGPHDCVVSGPLGQLQVLRSHFMASNVKCTFISVPYGYHSPFMLPILDDLTSVAKRIKIRAPSIPIVSNVLGEVVMPGDAGVFNPEYYARHCLEPVQFERGVASLHLIRDMGAFSWLEIGPHVATLSLVKANTPSVNEEKTMFLGSMRKGVAPWVTLGSSLAEMYVAGVAVHWRNVFERNDPEDSPRCISLPTYPFAKTKFWVPFKEDAVSGALPRGQSVNTPAKGSISDLVSHFAFLGACVQCPSVFNGHIAIFDTPIESLRQWIQGHRVAEASLCPGSLYGELVLQGIRCVTTALGHISGSAAGTEATVVLTDIVFTKPLVVHDGEERIVRTEITMPGSDGIGSFTLSSLLRPSISTSFAAPSFQTVHCTGSLSTLATSLAVVDLASEHTSISAKISKLTSDEGAESTECFSKRTIYEVIFPRVVAYSEVYRTINKFVVQESGMEGYAVMRMSLQRDEDVKETDGDMQSMVQPIFVDSMLHAAGFLANLRGQSTDAFLCTKVGSVTAMSSSIRDQTTFGIYVTLNSTINGFVADAVAVEAPDITAGGPTSQSVVARVQGMEFRKVKISSLRRSLRHYTAGDSSGPATPECAPPKSLSPRTSMQRTSSAPLVQTLAKNNTPGRPLYSTRAVSYLSATSTVFSSYSEPAMNALAEVVQIIAQTCDVSPIDIISDIDADLESFGVDSLMSIEILAALRRSFPSTHFLSSSVASSLLSQCKSVADIIRVVEGTQDQTGSTAEKSFSSSEGTYFEDHVPDSPMLCDPSLSSLKGTAFSSHSDHNSDSATRVKSVLSSVLDTPIHDLGEDVLLDSLGMDSLTSIEAQSALANAFGYRGHMSWCNLLDSCLSVRDVVNRVKTLTLNMQCNTDGDENVGYHPTTQYSIEEAADPAGHIRRALSDILQIKANPLRIHRSSPAVPVSSYFPLPPISDLGLARRPSSRTPVVFIHDGSGLVSYLRRLPSLERDIWGIQNPMFLGNTVGEDAKQTGWNTLGEMADAYKEYVLDAGMQSQRKAGVPLGDEGVILAGWSFGGCVAFEVARRLMQDNGYRVRGVILIDSPYPPEHITLNPNVINAVLTSRNLDTSVPSQTAATRSHLLRELMFHQFSENTALLKNYGSTFLPAAAKCDGEDGSWQPPYPHVVLLRSEQGFSSPTVRSEDLPVWLRDRTNERVGVDGWEALVGSERFKVLGIPGDHFSVFDNKNITEVARQISSACSLLEGA